MDPYSTLVAAWQADARNLRDWGVDEAARVLERCAEQLAERVATWADELVDLNTAAAESGYSIAHLRRLISKGVLQDRANEGPPQLRRGDLPRKPGHHVTETHVAILRTG